MLRLPAGADEEWAADKLGASDKHLTMRLLRLPNGEYDFAEYERRERRRQKASLVDGQHYCLFAAQVKQLMRAKANEEAAALLVRLVDAQERELKADPYWPLSPWYFDKLMSVYERLGRRDLVEKLQRRAERLLASRKI